MLNGLIQIGFEGQENSIPKLFLFTLQYGRFIFKRRCIDAEQRATVECFGRGWLLSVFQCLLSSLFDNSSLCAVITLHEFMDHWLEFENIRRVF